MDYQNLKPVQMEIKILGTGCSRCRALEKAVSKAIRELEIDVIITKVEDLAEIIKYGVMITPALVINDKVIVKARVPKTKELRQLIINNL